MVAIIEMMDVGRKVEGRGCGHGWCDLRSSWSVGEVVKVVKVVKVVRVVKMVMVVDVVKVAKLVKVVKLVEVAKVWNVVKVVGMVDVGPFESCRPIRLSSRRTGREVCRQGSLSSFWMVEAQGSEDSLSDGVQRPSAV